MPILSRRSFRMTIACCLLLAAGCAKTPEPLPQPVFQQTFEEAAAAIEKAEKDLNVLISLAAPKNYPQEFARAEESLRQAKTFLQSQDQDIDRAYDSAQQSLSAEQGVLRKLYAEMAESSGTIKTEIERISTDDPDNPLQDTIPELEKLLDDYDARQEIDAAQLARDMEKLKQIEYNTKKNLGNTFESDVSFGAGEYELSDMGKQAVQAYYQDVLNAKQQFRALFPNDPLNVTVKVIGHADQVGILPGTQLYKQITEGVENLPRNLNERQTFLNQRLSELRAKAIADYTKALILQDKAAGEELTVEQIIEGAGEKIPPNLDPPYPYQDPRRRVCRIYCWMSTQ